MTSQETDLISNIVHSETSIIPIMYFLIYIQMYVNTTPFKFYYSDIELKHQRAGRITAKSNSYKQKNIDKKWLIGNQLVRE